MRLLLDTHVWIWSLLEPERLTPEVAGRLTDEEAELWLSPISVWELLVLAEKGRVELTGDPQTWLDDALVAAPLREATLNHEIARESRHIDLPHDDPADRFLAATARVLDLTLVTADRRLLEAPAVATLANR